LQSLKLLLEERENKKALERVGRVTLENVATVLCSIQVPLFRFRAHVSFSDSFIREWTVLDAARRWSNTHATLRALPTSR